VVYASVGDSRIVATTPPDVMVRFGQPIWLTVVPDKVHLFDVETERRLDPDL
jgi:hypothetical protein